MCSTLWVPPAPWLGRGGAGRPGLPSSGWDWSQGWMAGPGHMCRCRCRCRCSCRCRCRFRYRCTLIFRSRCCTWRRAVHCWGDSCMPDSLREVSLEKALEQVSAQMFLLRCWGQPHLAINLPHLAISCVSTPTRLTLTASRSRWLRIEKEYTWSWDYGYSYNFFCSKATLVWRRDELGRRGGCATARGLGAMKNQPRQGETGVEIMTP